MTWSSEDFAGLAERAAKGAGFPEESARTFGRAAAVHLARGGRPDAIAEALRDPADSPILRLPLLMRDVMRAAKIAGPSVALSVLPADRALAPDYAELLPVALRDVTVMDASAGGPARLSAIVTEEPPTDSAALPALEVPESLVETLDRLANRALPAAEAARDAAP
ncbi:hypothetical protein [Citreimonas salinaria]|uniref:Uncharacterized protein n=1 Tax=Citreimonas salinaria TaxID=321339 RepID=A0A1H3M6Y2_9RHOB|nr:hypothetical protein [Citreimonas salinaria]SDY72487.1 hypothetical protein SAMN05444340_1161 [Citreimonas salinaria]